MSTTQAPCGLPASDHRDESKLKRAVIVVNESAGGAADAQTIARCAEGAFERAGMRTTSIVARADRIGAAFAEAARARPDLLAVGGGDGTIRGAARVCLRTGAALAIIPLGTMNLLAKDIGMPPDPFQAIEAIATGRTRRIDVGEVNGRLFLHSSTIGIVPRLGEQRERIRRNPGSWAGAMGRVWQILSRATRASITIEAEGRSTTTKTFALAVVCNPIAAEGPAPLLRPSLDSGKLAIYLARHRGRLGLLRLLISIGSGQWAIDPNIVDAAAARVVIGARRATMRVSNDGELETLDLPLEYGVRPQALSVVVPAS